MSDHFTSSYTFDFTNPKKLSQKKGKSKNVWENGNVENFLKPQNIEY
jgi:hypothetical protein